MRPDVEREGRDRRLGRQSSAAAERRTSIRMPKLVYQLCHMAGHALVSKERAGDAELPHRREDERRADGEEHSRDDLDFGVLERLGDRLMPQSLLIERVAIEPQEEDGRRESIAGGVAPTAEELGQDVLARLGLRRDVPSDLRAQHA